MPDNELSERERGILRLVATGASNKEIAQKLSISTNTVKVHLRNIFAKIGVASRTEATLYAIRGGLVQVDSVPPTAASSHPPIPQESLTVQPQPIAALAPAAGESVSAPPIGVAKESPRRFWVIAVILGILVVIASSLVLLNRQIPTTAFASPVSPATASRWHQRAAMPTARSGLAAAAYENQIYAIGGQTDNAITGAVERYSPVDDTWVALQSKPLPVVNASAAVVGGRIFVPGGSTASGAPTDAVEVYEPREDRWGRAAALPVAISGYALAAFEGKLFLFGGWDGKRYLASVYEYDPQQDVWQERTPMPTARAYAAAAVAGGKIYVMGGYDGKHNLVVNEEYMPDRDNGSANPWSRRTPLPIGRSGMGAATLADIVFVFGGEGESGKEIAPLEYLHGLDAWQSYDTPSHQAWSYLAVVPLETKLFILGGKLESKPASQNMEYQAIFTTILPPSP